MRKLEKGVLPARLLCVGLVALTCQACSIVPKDGPTGEEVVANAEVVGELPPNRLSYALVKLNPGILNTINRFPDRSLGELPRLPARGASADIRMSAGDTVSVAIFESAPGGLLAPAEATPTAHPASFLQIPPQQIDSAGYITVPYVGAVKVAGRTTREASAEISRRLGNRAIDPQTVLTINERRGNEVAVLGAVNAPTKFSIDPGGLRLMGAIAKAGGSKFPDYESRITLQRGDRDFNAYLSAVVENPKLNVRLAPGDVVNIAKEPKMFLVFGATPGMKSVVNTTRRIPFEANRLTVAEGLAMAGGLENQRADPTAVFLLRLERRDLLSAIGVNVSGYRQNLIPTVYSLDLSQSEDFFLMNQFQLHNEDILLVADSPSADFVKLADIVNSASTAAYNLTGSAYFARLAVQ